MKLALVFLTSAGLVLGSCTGEPQAPDKNTGALSTAEVEVTSGSTGGLDWKLVVRHEGSGDCVVFLDGENGRHETCGPLDIVMVNANRLDEAKRLDNLHFKCIDFVVGAVRTIVSRVRVEADGMDPIEMNAIVVPGFEAKFFATDVPVEIGDVTVSGLDSHGTIIGNQLIPQGRSSGVANCDR